MKKIRGILLALPVCLTLLFVPALSAVEVSVDESIENERRTIDDDYLFLGETLGFSGTSDSLFFFGKSLLMSGENRGNLIAAGESIDVQGTVADDTFLAGRTLNLTGSLGSTSFVAGETVNLFEGASVAGALFAAGSQVTIAGDITGDLYVGARRLVISGRIDGNVRVGAEGIEIRDGSVITGDFTYDSREELSQAEVSAIEGEVTFKQFDPEERWEEKKPWPFRVGKWLIGLILLLSVLVFTLLLYLFPGLRQVGPHRDHRHFWITVAWGLIPFFTYPLIIGALFLAGILFGITVPIAVTLLFSLGLLSYILSALALPQIGSYISSIFRRRLHQEEESRVFLKSLLGFLPVLILGMIPFLNLLMWIVVLSLGWGVALEKLFNTRFGPQVM
jgi:hypothetical protein